MNHVLQLLLNTLDYIHLIYYASLAVSRLISADGAARFFSAATKLPGYNATIIDFLSKHLCL